MKTSLLIIGSGGDGVKILGEIIARSAALSKNFYVFCYALYTPASRGGMVNSGIIITDESNSYPYIEKADYVFLMPGAKAEKTAEHTKVIRVPKIENMPINIVALGMLKKYFPALKITEENILNILEKEFGEKNFDKNKKTFAEGEKLNP